MTTKAARARAAAQRRAAASQRQRNQQLAVRPRGSIPRSRPAAVPKKSALDNQTNSYAQLLANPCTGSMAQPLYGASEGGYMARTTRVVEIQTDNNYTHGYVVWFPDYIGISGSASASTKRNGSLFIFQATAASTNPTNTIASPLGQGGQTQSATGQFINDPMYPIASGDLVQDCRTAAACTKFSYTGRNDALSGRVGYLNNVPREALLTGDSGLPPDVNNMILYSDCVGRCPMDTLENKFRPSSASQYYRTTGTVSTSGSDLGTDCCFLAGVPGSSITEVASGMSSGSSNGIGFIWSGVAADQSIALEFHKVVEWRPDMVSTLVAPPPTSSADGTNVVARAIAFLDHRHPGWQRKAMTAVASTAARVAQLAFSGPTNLAIRAGVQMISG